MIYKKLDVTILIMTQNEEENVEFAIKSVINNFEQVIVVDSFSTDRTTEICKKYSKLEIYNNKFISFSEQRNWILNNCKIRNEIVFFLDADEYVNWEFIQELRNIIESNIPFDSIYLTPKYIFFETHLKYAYGHPKIRRIFKNSKLVFTGEGAREYANKEGISLIMKTPFIHYDRKPISSWIDKHNKNSDREVASYFRNNPIENSVIPIALKIKMWIRNSIWNRLPLLLRPSLYFVYRYFIQLGFLDMRPGYIYCYLHAYWYQSIIDIKILEAKSKKLKEFSKIF